MTEREKLMNMIRIGRACPGNRDPFGEHCETCHYFDSKECDVERFADYLLANGVTFQKWIPVTERLPDEKELVLCVGAKGGLFLGYPWWISHNDTAYTSVPNARGGRYTKYWMPLPEPPKEG